MKFLQIAIDTNDYEEMINIVSCIPDDNRIIIEAGTPLIKQYGIDIIKSIKDVVPGAFVVADLKTLDTGAFEVQIAKSGTANAIVVSGLAPIQTIDNVISAAQENGLWSIIDTLNVSDPVSMLKELKTFPNIVEIHRAIDAEATEYQWSIIPEIKSLSTIILIAVAGGVQLDNIKEAEDVDIFVVGRSITAAEDIEGTIKAFLKEID